MIEVDFSVDARDLLTLDDKIKNGVEAGIVAITEKVADVARDRAGDIESRPIPTSSTGRPLWERSGDLQDSIEASFPSAESGQIAAEGKAEVYATRRHQLGEPDNDFGDGWTPKNPAGGIVRNDPFFKDAEEESADDLGSIFEAAFNPHLQ